MLTIFWPARPPCLSQMEGGAELPSIQGIVYAWVDCWIILSASKPEPRAPGWPPWRCWLPGIVGLHGHVGVVGLLAISSLLASLASACANIADRPREESSVQASLGQGPLVGLLGVVGFLASLASAALLAMLMASLAPLPSVASWGCWHQPTPGIEPGAVELS